MSISICVIGAGRIGRIHASNVVRHPDAELRYVVDVNDESARRLAAETSAAVASVETALADDSLDAVVIASSTDTHLPLIEACAAAGKAVFCEKPLDLDVDRARRCVEAAAAGGIPLAVGFNRRYDPSFRRLRDGIAAGHVGSVEVVTITSRDPSPPPLDYLRRSGGLFRDMTIHDFDMARFLIGAEVEEVYAAGAVRVDPAIGEAGDVDTAVVTLRFADGTIGSIDNSRQAVYGYDQRAEVFGSLGSIRTGNNFPNAAVISRSDGIRRDTPLHFFIERYADSYVAEMRAFVDAVHSGAPVPVSGEDGRTSVLMGLAAGRSHDENRPVRLSEVDSA